MTDGHYTLIGPPFNKGHFKQPHLRRSFRQQISQYRDFEKNYVTKVENKSEKTDNKPKFNFFLLCQCATVQECEISEVMIDKHPPALEA